MKQVAMDIQRIRNLTTGRLHTKIEHVYQDIEKLTGTRGIMTHTIPRALRALEPWLKGQLADKRFWDGTYDTEHVGELHIVSMDSDEQAKFFDRFCAEPNPLEGKRIVTVVASK